MLKSPELPDCFYPSSQPILVRPSGPTPQHSLSLSNLDDQKFLRFSIKYMYLFKKSVSFDSLKCSLSKVLVDYYPLAGRLRSSPVAGDGDKLEVDCNGEGAVMAEAFMDLAAQEFLQCSELPNRSWRRLLYKVEALGFVDVPPLVIQVTYLRCGGMILCTAINHCLCDGIGTSQFLYAWAAAHITVKSDSSPLTIAPFHSRHVLRPRTPAQITCTHPSYTKIAPTPTQVTVVDVLKLLQSQPLVPTSFTFTPTDILRLKKRCVPSPKCTTFEALAAHTWRCWVRSLGLSPSLMVKLLFSVNVRKKLNPEIPKGYYGNGFVLACAYAAVKDLVTANLHYGIKLVQQAKAAVDDECVRSIIDFLEDKSVRTDLSASFVISQWSKLGLEDVNFGQGKPLCMSPLTSDIYCLFLPVIGDPSSVRVLVSVSESVGERFEYYMITEPWEDDQENGDANYANGNNGHMHQ